MSRPTSWTLIRAAGAGEPAAREEFVRRYGSVLRDYFGARWRGSPREAQVEDAVHEVLVRCMEAGNPLERADPERPGGFRPYLAGICRNVALAAETARGRERPRGASGPPELAALEAREERLSRVFDRAFAEAVMGEARRLQAERAGAAGERALRRVELLRLRFEEGLAIRQVAAAWGVEAATLHHEYARAREEFREALHEAVAFHCPGAGRERIEAEARALTAALSVS